MKRRQKRRLHALAIQKLGYSQLKPEQLKVIMEFIRGKDVFAVLPTGFGKTRAFNQKKRAA